MNTVPDKGSTPVSVVDIVIVSYNTAAILEECLLTLTTDASPHSQLHIIVVDNASSDGTAQMITERFPSITLICNTENRGYTAAANQGISAGQGEAVLLLNSDTVATPPAIGGLVTTLMAHPTIGIIAPRIVDSFGRAEASWGPEPGSIAHLLGSSLSALLPSRSLWWAAYRPVRPHVTQPVPWASGACLLIRRAVLDRVGMLDEHYPMYFEDVDLCRRARQAGWSVVCSGQYVVIHRGGASWGQRRGSQRARRDASQILYYVATRHRHLVRLLRLRRWIRRRYTTYYVD